MTGFACRFICHGLITGEKYVFRVRAVNAAGLSQFSPESEPVEVKAAIGEWSHDRGASGSRQSGIEPSRLRNSSQNIVILCFFL